MKERSRLEAELGAEQADSFNKSGTLETRDEVAEKFEDEEERTATSETLSERLKDVNDALTKIASGTYGACEINGEPIEADRLEANPAARTCKKHLANLNDR